MFHISTREELYSLMMHITENTGMNNIQMYFRRTINWCYRLKSTLKNVRKLYPQNDVR